MVTPELPDWATRTLGEDGAERIESAIAAAESRTSAEIVPILVRRSSTVGHVALIVFLLLLVCGLLFDAPELLAGMAGSQGLGLSWLVPRWLGLGVSWLLAGGLALGLARLGPIQRWLTPRADQAHQVDMRAELEFFELEMHRTEDRTGILLFVSLMEHRAVVLADRAIASRLDAEIWQEVIDLMIEGVKKDDLAAGMVRAIERCGELVTPCFPIGEGDINELRDHLVVKD